MSRVYISRHVIFDESNLQYVVDFQQETKIKGTLKLINFHEFEAWTNKLVVIGDFC